MPSFYRYVDDDFSLSHSLSPTPDQSRFVLHTHHRVELYYFVKGSGTFHIEGSAYPLESGDLLIMQPAESHYIELDLTQPYERKVLHFDPEVLKTVDPNGHLFSPFFTHIPGKQNLYKSHLFRHGSCEHYFDTMMTPDPDPRISIFAGMIPLLHELCSIHENLCEDANSVPDSVAHRIIRYLNQNMEKPVSLSDICQRFYISKSQLCREFRKSTGVTVKSYLTVKRLVKAKQLIDAGEYATHVYPQCGFNDYSSFYRAYVKYYGCAPTKNQ